MKITILAAAASRFVARRSHCNALGCRRNTNSRRQQRYGRGEALDLLHGAAFCPAITDIRPGDYQRARIQTSSYPAGLRRKPDESRLDLINRNVALFRANSGQHSVCRIPQGGAYIRRVQPVDVLTHLPGNGSAFLAASL